MFAYCDELVAYCRAAALESAALSGRRRACIVTERMGRYHERASGVCEEDGDGREREGEGG